MGMRRDLRVDVSAAAATGEQLTVAATVVLPDGVADRPGEPRAVVVGFPGGGYNRRYYDLDIPGHDGYSQARYHLARGHVFVACDHLGVGESDTPACPLDYDAVARANMHAASEVLRLLREGGIAGGVPPVSVMAAAAIGQSFGGFLLVIGQATDPVFDGIGVLGYSARDPQTPWPAHLTLDDVLSLRAGNGRDHPMRPWFHRDDVPGDIVLADMTKRPGSIGSAAPWSADANPGGPAVRSARRPRDPAAVAAEAARIAVPVLVACGEVDVVPDPWREPTAYRGSPHVTTAVIARMAHMHNFASTRHELWDVIDDWLAVVTRRARR
jgi:pimeloyl-ACP methyl ester carboxylesterase